MTDAIRHRGPDDGGTWTDGTVGLGSRRLAVLDLSPRGHQPMSNAQGTVHLAFNGEIYNFRELRRDLVAKGHAFASDCDTEVVLRLYEEEGVECLRHLRGMFAFAIWDVPQRTLFLARDRLGKKPLFYQCGSHGIVFGSEPKVLLQDPDVPAEADPLAVHHYLTYGYVPGPFSAFAGMRKLPPAHYLLARDGDVSLHRYWSLHFVPKLAGNEDDLAHELLGRLEEAVRLRLVSDVPLGALLSGGIDSSAVVAIMRRLGANPLRTFSIGFEEPAYDELAHARTVARRFETEHHELVVRPDAVAMLPRLVWHYNEPYADSSAVPSFYLCQMARESVTVALAGDGGDELFAGYDRYLAAALTARVDFLPPAFRRAVARAFRAIGPRGAPKSTAYRIAQLVDGIPLPPIARYARWLTMFDAERKRSLYSDDFAAETAASDSLCLLEEAYARSDAPTFLEATMHADIQMYLPDDLLVKMDIASMASSLEVRSPFLDHPLVEFAAALPARLKLHRLSQKYLLKRALRDLLPEQILSRPKMGFGVPIDRWLRGDLRQMAYDLLLDSRAIGRGYFRRHEVRRLLDAHTSGSEHHHHRLWSLLMLELWHRTFIDQSCPGQVPCAADVDASAMGEVVGGQLSL